MRVERCAQLMGRVVETKRLKGLSNETDNFRRKYSAYASEMSEVIPDQKVDPLVYRV